MPDSHLPTLPRNRENDRLRARIVELEAEVEKWHDDYHEYTSKLRRERDEWRDRYYEEVPG